MVIRFPLGLSSAACGPKLSQIHSLCDPGRALLPLKASDPQIEKGYSCR